VAGGFLSVTSPLACLWLRCRYLWNQKESEFCLLGSVGWNGLFAVSWICMGASIHSNTHSVRLGWVGTGALRFVHGWAVWGFVLVVGLLRDIYTMLLIPPLLYPSYTITRCFIVGASSNRFLWL